MDMKEIKRMVKLMVDNDLTEMNIVDGDQKIALKRGPGQQGGIVMEPAVIAAPAQVAQAAAPAAAPEPESNLIDVISPMVGTFYTAPSPDSGPFVAVGDTINDETVVCIIEAMKVMNEIKAECSGKIAEICVTGAQPVEFGQVLFRLTPA
ncbi:MAG: acetyl-CoA carboxylase biotin carboxyl carrier protein [Phycisphaerales bacterium]|jgi:acetyl-CoA carboxylase biotin carboxyl carrier protein|nr:acetyl-CoA carboxylase biotin carboxyl carrier protein [Phycisphaerales bacterium]